MEAELAASVVASVEEIGISGGPRIVSYHTMISSEIQGRTVGRANPLIEMRGSI